jgi:hypothetical protein
MSLYATDQFAREAIDILLKRNAARQANLGTESTDEERESTKQDWRDSLKIISVIDPEFWGVIQE